ncbi:MAG: hypothetical protein O2914_03775 [Bacteroidetes bacterium]|nr:hypothetical protein [Bacteroidota bacterium]MDA0937935.1 hypothetical protein [Bacteroidota bacterium]MDA1344035.1 hypothetical protein [Bacteroidota bacterium]
MARKSLVLFLVFILGLSLDMSWAQCSMCRAVLESEEGQQTAKGINDGILYLMAIPYVLVGIVGWQIIRIMKKKDA